MRQNAWIALTSVVGKLNQTNGCFFLLNLEPMLFYTLVVFFKFLVVMSPPTSASLGQKILFWLKEIGKDNNQETKFPISYMTADSKNLARGS